jgi:hypothetical protein
MTSVTERGARAATLSGAAGLPITAARLAVTCVIGAVAGGCVLGTTLKAPEPTAVTQQLVMRSLERAVAQLDIGRVQGRRVALEVFAQAGNPGLTRAFVAAWLEEHGVRVVRDSADLTVHVLISALGMDRGETLVGLPAFQAPIVSVPVPEIALFKWTRNRSLTEMQLYVFDAKTGSFVDKGHPVAGRAKRDDFTVLLLIGFTVTDVDEGRE